MLRPREQADSLEETGELEDRKEIPWPVVSTFRRQTTRTSLDGSTLANAGRNHDLKTSICVPSFRPSFFLARPWAHTSAPLPFLNRWWVEMEAQWDLPSTLVVTFKTRRFLDVSKHASTRHPRRNSLLRGSSWTLNDYSSGGWAPPSGQSW